MKSIKYTFAAVAIAAMGLTSCSKDDPTVIYNDIENVITEQSKLVEEIIDKDVTVKLLPDYYLVCAYQKEINLAESIDPNFQELLFASKNSNLLSVNNQGVVKAMGFDPQNLLVPIIVSYKGEIIQEYEIAVVGEGTITTQDKTFDVAMCEYFKGYHPIFVLGKSLPTKPFANPIANPKLTLELSSLDESIDCSILLENKLQEWSWDNSTIEPIECSFGGVSYQTNPQITISVDNNIIKFDFSAESKDGKKITIQYEGPLMEQNRM